MGTEVLSQKKLPGLDVDHSLPSSAEVKNEWSQTSTLSYAFMLWTGLYCFKFYTFLTIFCIDEDRTVN